MSRHLFISQDFGLCNRLRGYVGAWSYAKKVDCLLDVLWTPSPACPYSIEELFEPLPGTRFITEKGEHDYSHTTNDHGCLTYILSGHGLILETAPLLIASLLPRQSIRRKLANLEPFLNKAIGIHIRRTDHVDYANTIGGPTPMETYYAAADASSALIFLACDDPSTLAIFKQRYGERILTAKAFGDPIGIRNTDGEHSVLDLYCLALCEKFQGSHASSFSSHALYLRTAWGINQMLRKQSMAWEKVVFSFSLFGDKIKYTEGMVVNARQISTRFPNARIQIYIADDVPADICERLSLYPNVRLVYTKRLPGTQNTLDRFKAVDDDDCDVLLSRDADSRVHDRDAACIEDFLASNKLLHIIRDHRFHNVRILAGMWGIRKKAITEPIYSVIHTWLASQGNPTEYGCDQNFLQHFIYPTFINQALIHDANGHFFSDEKDLQPFRIPIVGKLFVGQVHDFNKNGDEFEECGID
jgi:hypothetical protein